MPSAALNRKRTGIILGLFNGEGYRLDLLHAVLCQLRQQTVESYIALGAMNLSSQLPENIRSQLDEVVEMQGASFLFQKEAIWNEVAKKLPEAIEHLIFLDADILPLTHDWIERVNTELDSVEFVQSFSLLIYLNRPATIRIIENPSRAWNPEELVREEEVLVGDRQLHDENVMVANPSYLFSRGIPGSMPGLMGGSLAFRRSYFEEIGGFPHFEIFAGLNDVLFFNQIGVASPESLTFFADSLAKWVPQNKKRKGTMSFVPCRLFHLWHQQGAKRRYAERLKEGACLKFEPARDIFINRTGGIELSPMARHRYLPVLKKIWEESLAIPTEVRQ